MTLFEAVKQHAEDLGEELELLVTDASPEQLAMDMETSDLSDLYAHFWGKEYVLVASFVEGKNVIIDAHRDPNDDCAPLLSRLVEA